VDEVKCGAFAEGAWGAFIVPSVEGAVQQFEIVLAIFGDEEGGECPAVDGAPREGSPCGDVELQLAWPGEV
jgi:hypothetical protein